MISHALLIYCLVVGGIYLLAVSILMEIIGSLMKVKRGIPAELLEKDDFGTRLTCFLIDYVFIVAIPTLAFAVLFTVLPLTGVRSGLAAALFAFTLGSAPPVILLSIKLRLYMPYLLFVLLSHLIKLAGSLAIIGYLYYL
ncbi:MAG TPA: hypothetical protein PLF13_10440 [candidate division Zixibacteria bacterium]|nr:hypothetical protein [candidate division Zixibacteria bacterium]